MVQNMGHNKKGGTKVFWTDEEGESVVQAAVKLAQEDKEFIIQFLTKAQKKVLPPERQRKVLTRNAASDKLASRFCKVRHDILDSKIPAQAESEDSIVITLEKEVLVERPREEILNGLSTEELTAEVIKRLVPVFNALGSIPELIQISRDRANQLDTISARPKFGPLPIPTKRNVRVLVFGFLPGQEQEIKSKAVGFNLDLVFYKKEGRQVEPPPSCQWCVMMKKVGHPAWNKVRDGVGTDRVFLVEGITDAMKKLADINSLVGTGVR